MNIFDKFLHSVSYKFPKGYPDMSNPTDVLLLETLISEVLGQNINLNEGSMKQNTVKAIQSIITSECLNLFILSNNFRFNLMSKCNNWKLTSFFQTSYSYFKPIVVYSSVFRGSFTLFSLYLRLP
jgi:hypothetical protein